jgi:hypothetical protein
MEDLARRPRTDSASPRYCLPDSGIENLLGTIESTTNNNRKFTPKGFQKLKRRPHVPIWDGELGQIIVARLVFGFVTRRIWFTRAEVKISFSKHHGIASLSIRRLLVLRYGPSARLQGVAIVADYDPSVQHSEFQPALRSHRFHL